MSSSYHYIYFSCTTSCSLSSLQHTLLLNSFIDNHNVIKTIIVLFLFDEIIIQKQQRTKFYLWAILVSNSERFLLRSLLIYITVDISNLIYFLPQCDGHKWLYASMDENFQFRCTFILITLIIYFFIYVIFFPIEIKWQSKVKYWSIKW